MLVFVIFKLLKKCASQACFFVFRRKLPTIAFKFGIFGNTSFILTQKFSKFAEISLYDIAFLYFCNTMRTSI